MGNLTVRSSSPDATMNFGEEIVDIHYSTHKKAMVAHHEAVGAELEETDKKESSKTSGKVKARDGQQAEIDLDDDGFKIRRGRAKRHRKKIEVTECLTVVTRVLVQDVDPDHNLVNEVKVIHEISPYGLSDIEWRCYILYLVNQDQGATLTTMSRRLVKCLEAKIY